MKYELSDMLAAGKADPPPPRYSVEDAVAAGRKRQSRRRALFAGAGSAAAVVAVAAAVAVPQIVSHGSGKSTTATNVPAAASPAKKPALTFPKTAFTGTIAPFKFGNLTVAGTTHVTPSYEVAPVIAPGNGTPTEDAKGKIHQSVNDAGHIVVYKAGSFSTAEFKKSGAKVTVNGHTGFYVAPKKLAPIKPGFPAGMSDSALAWEYADDSWAVADLNSRAKVTEKQLIALAGQVVSGAPETMKVDFKLGYVPAGFKLAAAGPSDMGLMTPIDGQSFLRLVKGTTDYTGLTGPVLDAPVVNNKQLPTLALAVYPSWYGKYNIGPKPSCVSESLCYKTTDNGKYFIELSGGGFVSDAELIKVLQSVKFLNPADDSTWVDATAAVS